MKIRVLGTSSAFPTKYRNHSANLIKYSGELLLFDCGEGTQRQIRIAKENPQKISSIFISHWHGDHSFGISGLMQSMGMNRRTKKLRIYGPVGTKEKINMLMKVFESDKLSYTVEVFDIDPKNVETIYENNLYKINAMKLVHTVDCIGFSFVEKDKIRINTDYLKSIGVPVMHPELKKLALEKNIEIDGKKINYKKSTYKELGKKVTIILDSSYDEKLVKLSKDSDLLICESTFSNKVKESAKKGGHMTSKEAAKLAKLSDSKKLLLTHFSQRYKSVDELKSEAKSIYKKEIIMAKDFMELKV
tara:strand:+ start:2823 stop:3731 length:909 start_codon:yes stop_codon:yes gene_type:complete